jgi:hypothetical protein
VHSQELVAAFVSSTESDGPLRPQSTSPSATNSSPVQQLRRQVEDLRRMLDKGRLRVAELEAEKQTARCGMTAATPAAPATSSQEQMSHDPPMVSLPAIVERIQALAAEAAAGSSDRGKCQQLYLAYHAMDPLLVCLQLPERIAAVLESYGIFVHRSAAEPQLQEAKSALATKHDAALLNDLIRAHSSTHFVFLLSPLCFDASNLLQLILFREAIRLQRLTILVTLEGARWTVNSYDHDFPPMSIFPAELRSSLNGKAVEHAEAYFDAFIGRLMKRSRRTSIHPWRPHLSPMKSQRRCLTIARPRKSKYTISSSRTSEPRLGTSVAG